METQPMTEGLVEMACLSKQVFHQVKKKEGILEGIRRNITFRRLLSDNNFNATHDFTQKVCGDCLMQASGNLCRFL